MKTVARLYDKSRINDPDYKGFGLGMIKTMQDQVHTSTLDVPIITYTAENAFVMDMSSTETITISFERNNDTNDGNIVEYEEDGEIKQRTMNNREWIEYMRGFVDQWQARHDGYILEYKEPGNDEERTDNLASISQMGYIKSFKTKFVCGVPEHISGSITFQPGSIRAKNGATVNSNTGYGQSINIEDTFIYMTSSDQSNIFPIHTEVVEKDGEGKIKNRSSLSCVSSYEYTCGPMEPFPYLKITLSKKRMSTIAPRLVDDIVAGRNLIYFNAAGKSTMIVTKCRSNNSNFTLTAYAIEEVYKGVVIGGTGYGYESTPDFIIRDVLSKKVTVGTFSFTHEFKNIYITPAKKEEPYVWKGSVNFPSNCSMWYVLQVCAARMGCTIWFEGEKVYVIDLKRDNSWLNDKYHYFSKTLYLNSVPGIPDENDPTCRGDVEFCQSVQDVPSLDDEGTDALINFISINYELNKEYKTVETDLKNGPDLIKESYSMFGQKAGSSYSIPEINNATDAQAIANNIPQITADQQQPITFTLSEVSPDGSKWQSYFPDVCHVKAFVDFNSETLIDNGSTYREIRDGKAYKKTYLHKLALSSVTRKFPEFSSVYTFGRLKNTDLSQTTSIIQQAIGNK